MTRRDSEGLFHSKRLNIYTHPVWARRGKHEFENSIEEVARHENKGDTQPQCGIDTPIQQRQDKKKEIFTAQITEKTHGQFKPCA